MAIYWPQNEIGTEKCHVGQEVMESSLNVSNSVSHFRDLSSAMEIITDLKK